VTKNEEPPLKCLSGYESVVDIDALMPLEPPARAGPLVAGETLCLFVDASFLLFVIDGGGTHWRDDLSFCML
jgi:hypothetical protein